MDVKIKSKNIKFKYRVSAIFINNNKLFVNKYNKNSFCLPGGYVKVGEKSSDAIIRELKEETNLNFEIVSFAGVAENFFTNNRNEKTHGLEFYYFVKLKNEDDFNNIDYSFIENENNSIIKHNFSWLNISKLNEYDILPKEIKKHLNDKEMFYIFINN